MGQKVHPTGFRIGIIQEWRSKWYARKGYADYFQEDIAIRKLIYKRNSEAGISRIDIERWANEVVITVHTARPGIIIGRGGSRVDELRRDLEALCGKKVRLNIQEVREPELDAFLVARNVASQIEHQIAFRRAIKRSITRTMQAGAKGIKIMCSGRLGGSEIARTVTFHEGRVPLHTLRADIDYGFTEAHTLLGRIGIKVWIYKGDVLPEIREEPVAAAVAVKASEDQSKTLEEVGSDATTEAGEVPQDA